MGRCVLPSKKNTSSRTRSASANAASTSPNCSDTALWTFGPSPYSWMRTSGWASASSIDISERSGSYVDLDQLARALRRLLVDRGHGRHRIADHADLVDAERLLVLGDGQDAELHGRQVAPGDDRVDAGQGARPRGVDALDQRVGVAAPQELPVGHAGQHHVVGEARLADDLGPGIDLGKRLADDRKALAHGAVSRAAAAPALTGRFMRSAASSTASRILV